jgi:TonB family protein
MGNSECYWLTTSTDGKLCKSQDRLKEAAMKLHALVMLMACATAAVAAEPPRTAMPGQPNYIFIAFKPDISDYYPAAARAMGEQGTASLVLCYDQRGRSIDVTVVNSSGFTRLDDAAFKWGKAVRVNPAVKDGAAQPGCVFVPAKFSLEKSQEPDQGVGTLPLPAVIWPLPPPSPPPVRLVPLEGKTA